MRFSRTDLDGALLDGRSLASILAAYRPRWMRDALCSEYDRETFFPRSREAAAAARSVCARCPVRSECRDYAVADVGLHGVWGGTTDRERQQLRSRRAA